MKYLITLKPLDKFFFGGAINFGEDSDSYIVKSNLFPQQTQILGMVRRELLVQNGYLTLKQNGEFINDVEQANNLVGNGSFDIENNCQKFGVINKISPLFLKKNNEYFFQTPKDFGLLFEKKDKNGEKSNFGNFIPFLDGYSAKDGLKEFFVSEKETKKESDIFIIDEQIGIKKSRDGGTEDNAFYKKISYRLKDNFEFAFIIEFNEEKFILDNNIVYLGAERSAFKMSIKKDFNREFKGLIPENYYQLQEYDRVILLSDSFVNEKILDDIDFSISDTIEFQSLISKLSTKEYKFKRSRKYNLLQKCSVLFGDIAKIEKHLNNSHLESVGYNIFESIKGSKK